MVKLIAIVTVIMILPLTGWQSSANAASAKIKSRDCKRLVGHQSSAEYKPGVDVRGRKVRGADAGGGSTYKLPKEFSFNIGVDIAEKYGLDDKNITASMTTGKVTVRGSRVYMNGKPMTSNEQAGLEAKCRKLLSGK
ncbi:MAG: hypothetical protein HN731_03325 [Rhodospirillaceae bacterium]|nr:hypothetical protein [Rhodospirillaceae bacterium]